MQLGLPRATFFMPYMEIFLFIWGRPRQHYRSPECHTKRCKFTGKSYLTLIALWFCRRSWIPPFPGISIGFQPSEFKDRQPRDLADFYQVTPTPSCPRQPPRPCVELIVSDSELTFPHIFFMFYITYIYHWRRVNQSNMNIIKKLIVIKYVWVQSLKKPWEI